MTVTTGGIALLVTGLWVTIPACAAAPDPTVAFLEPTQPLPDSLDVKPPHMVTIRRVAHTPEERRALEVAERTDPPRDSVLAAMGHYDRRLDSLPSEPRIWWTSSFDGVRRPYAITDAAVRYYLALGRAFRRGDFREVHGLRMSSSSVRYVAAAERQAEIEVQGRRFRDVYVVRLELTWNNYCGNLRAMNVTAKRTVIVSPEGEVLLIVGDGQAWGYVS